MSSMAKPAVTAAPVTGLPAAGERDLEAVGHGGAVGIDAQRDAVAGLLDRLATAPGPTRADGLPRSATAFAGGARLVSTAAANTAPATTTTSPPTSRRSTSAAAACPASSRGRVRSRLTAASSSAPQSRRDLDQQRLAVARLPQRGERRQLQDRGADAGGDQREHGADRDVREARHGDGEARDAALAGRLRQRTSRPISPPIQTAPAARCTPVERDREAARRRLAGVAGDARDQEHRGGGEQRAGGREQLGDRAARALGRSSAIAIAAAAANSARHSSRSR